MFVICERRVILHTIGALLVAATCAAQAPAPGWVQMPDGGWLPPDHPVARAYAFDHQPTPPQATETLTGCDHPNPYVSGPNTECIIGTYRVGKVFAFGQVERALVLGIAALPDGTEVVTVAFLDVLGAHRGGPDHVWSFRNDGSYRPWTFTAARGF